MRRDYSEPRGGRLWWIATALLLLFMIVSIAAAADTGTTVMPSNKDTLLRISNDESARFNDYGNNTYHFFNPAQSATQGLNAFHITTDASNSDGQVTFSGDQSGVFYLTDTGGRGWDDDAILMLAVNGTVPDDFRVHIQASGYRWAPVLTGTFPAFDSITYVPDALNETFTKDDFLYGPQIWRPCTAPDYPIFDGQDMTDTGNTFSIMFIDLNAGILGANTLSQPDFSGQSITDNGAIKVEYSFENLETFAAFDGYVYTVSSNQGQGIRWTNRLSADSSSGYTVAGIPPVLTSINVTPASADVGIGTSMQFTAAALDQNNRPMSDIAIAWSSSDETVGTVNETGYFTALASGTTTLTAANGTFEGTATVTVTAAPPGPQPLPDYNNVFFTVANDAGVKYNAFGNNTYNIRFEGYDRGLNALHISTDPAVNFGQVTVSENQTGTFYATDSGGKGYEDEIILMVAVNGTIPDTFRLRVKADGYTWTPNPVSNQAPPLDTVTYQSSALDEVFTKEDFRYGPQIWKPTGNGFDYPIYCGQDMSDAANTFQAMFIDLNAGVLRPNTALENRGAVRINYSFENLDTFAAFSVYGYCKNSNNGDNMVAWSNALLTGTTGKETSGYSVIGAGAGPAPSRIEVSPVTAALSVGDDQQFVTTAYDADDNAMTGITVAWSSTNETVGTVNATGSFTALAAGTTNVTASYGAVSGSAAVTVTEQSGGLADSAWPMVGHDLRHTGQSPYTGPRDPMQKWSYTTAGFLTIQPVIDQNGTIYVGSRDRSLHAVNPDGTLKWSYTAGHQIYTAAAIGSDGTVYFGCRDTKIYAVNPDGTLKWTFTTGGAVSSAPAIGSDGTIYAGSADTKIHALNPDGTEKWSYTAGGAVSSAPAIGHDGTIYAGSADMKIYALNPDGTLKWSYTTAGAVNTAPAIGSDGTIYAGSADGSLYAINPDSTLKWSYATGGAVASPAIGPDGTIYAGSASKTVNAVNPDGTLKWSYTTTGTVTEAPAVDAAGTVYISSTDRNDRNLYAIGSDGTLKWTFLDPVSPRFFYAPSIGADGTIYVGSSDSNLYAIESAAPVLTNITVIPSSTTIAIGKTQLFTASGIDQYGDPVENITYSWTIDNETVGTINSTGLFTAVTEGNATITASSGGALGNATVTVLPPPKEWYVDGNGGGNFTTIQAAIDSVKAGDTIIVRPGTYSEKLTITKPLTLRSASGAALTTIHSNGGAAIAISADSVTVDGFNVTGVTDTYASAISLDSASHSFRIANNTIIGAHTAIIAKRIDNADGIVENNSCIDGDNGIIVSGSSNVVVRNNFISDSWMMGISVSLDGGASHDDIISGNVIQNTTMGALHMYYASNCVVSNNTFYNNGFVRENVGCALFIAGNVKNNVFFGNSFIGNERLGFDQAGFASNRWNSDEAYTYTYKGSVYTGPIGNYWGGSFALDDTDGNGISNIPTQLYGTYADNYPLIQPAGRYFGIEDDLPVPTSVHAFSPESPYVPVGASRQFVLSVNDQNSNEMVNGMVNYWSSSDESVATIDADGVLKAHAKGTTVITGRCADIAVSTMVTVTGDVSSITVTPAAVNLTAGETQQFVAIAYDADKTAILDVAFTWTSSDATVGTVNASGVFTAHKIGTTTVRASYGGAFGNATVTVTPPHGDQTTDSSLNIPGCNMTTKGDGKQEISINTTATNATVSGNNTIRIDEDTFSLIIETEGAPTVVNGTVNGTVVGITLNTAPITTVLDGVGTVTASLAANLTDIPAGAGLQTTVSANVSADAQRAFQIAARGGGLNLDAVAYTMNIVKTNLTDSEDIADATIRMAVSPAWVDAHGGDGAVRILRWADNGTKEVLKTVLVGNDADGNMIFEAYSPNGLSVFGLTTVSAAPSSGNTGSSRSSGGSSDIAAISGSIPAGETKSFAVTQTAISRITVSAWDPIDDMLVTVKKTSLPKGVDAPAQTTFEVIETTLYRVDPSAIDTVTFEFAVPSAWIREHGLSTDSIVLLGYEKDRWKSFPTEFLKEENDRAFYSAEASGFSYFAIVTGKTTSAGQQAGETVTPAVTATVETTAPATEPTTQQSPLPLALPIVAFGAIAFIWKRK
jgi:PGF-pre-PGF domain-containing protein